jgi:hypothetical protein
MIGPVKRVSKAMLERAEDNRNSKVLQEHFDGYAGLGVQSVPWHRGRGDLELVAVKAR